MRRVSATLTGSLLVVGLFAERIARATKGVTDVHNELSVGKVGP